MRLSRLIGPELRVLVEESPEELGALLDEIHPEDIADIMDEQSDDAAADLLQKLPTEYAARVFARLDEHRQEELASVMSVDSTALLAVEMDADERADFFSELPPAFSQTLLEKVEAIDPEAAEEVEELSRWSETSAGGLMTTEYVALGPGLTITQAMSEVRRLADETETLDTVYVVEKGDRIRGLLTLKDILLANPESQVKDVMHGPVISVPPRLDQEDVARKLAKYDLNTLPVVSAQGELLGVITSDDILDVMTEEQSEDVHKLGAVEPLSDGYFDTSQLTFIRKRAPWLLVLFFGGFMTTSAMQAFDGVLAAVAQLSFYVPMLISAGGNSGSQSSTLVIRGLAVGDIKASDWWRVLARELLQGMVLGALLAGLGVARVMIAGHGQHFAVLVAVTIVSIVVMGCVVGGMMPILLHRAGLDPATSSTPFIATLVDVLGILIYLSLAQVMLRTALETAKSFAFATG